MFVLTSISLFHNRMWTRQPFQGCVSGSFCVFCRASHSSSMQGKCIIQAGDVGSEVVLSLWRSWTSCLQA